MSHEEMLYLSAKALRAIVNSTSAHGRFREEWVMARAELARRERKFNNRRNFELVEV